MKAACVIEWGQPLEIRDVPKPEVGSDEVLVRVYAASINPVDAAIAAGYVDRSANLPMTLGTDFAGVVEDVGVGVDHVAVGDGVYGLMPIRGGAFAEYAVARGYEVAHKPQSLDYAAASAVPLPALAAWQSIFGVADLQSGERLLVLGAGGAVGSFAVQLAKERGAYVIGVDKASKADYLQKIGVDEFIEADAQQFEDVASDVDVVLDLVGGEIMQRAYGVLKKGGRFVTTMGPPPQEAAAELGISANFVFTQANRDQLTQIAELIDAGKVQVLVRRTFPLSAAPEAMALLRNANDPGKLVLLPE